MNGEVYAVVTINTGVTGGVEKILERELPDTGMVVDVEVLEGPPQWGGEDLPVGVTQIVRRGYVNGGDTVVVRRIVGVATKV